MPQADTVQFALTHASLLMELVGETEAERSYDRAYKSVEQKND